VKDIKVYDGLVSTQTMKEIYHLVRESRYGTTEKDYPQLPDDQKMLSCNLEMDNKSLFQLAKSVSEKIPNNEDYYLERVYVNAYTSSDSPRPHQDTNDNSGLTILYYANDDWNWEYGGETVFFNDAMDVVKAVLPRPGRVVIFNSILYHCARSQNNLGPKFRYTIAFKLRMNI
jgi:Rps23 Pro-64 3,4-dihydroxylase Tpa1-like proline 4-hydroxylase